MEKICYALTVRSEKATMAFQVSKSYNSRTKHYFANPHISIQENVSRSLQKLSLSLHLSLSSCIAVYTHSTVYLAAHAHPRHNYVFKQATSVLCICMTCVTDHLFITVTVGLPQGHHYGQAPLYTIVAVHCYKLMCTYWHVFLNKSLQTSERQQNHQFTNE